MAELIEEKNKILDTAVAAGEAYEILNRRLKEQGAKLKSAAQNINERRLQEFGRSEMEVAGRVRIRTENNCIARDIVRIGNNILFGYNVFLGLKKETKIADVFSFYHLESGEDGYEATMVPLDGTFLEDPTFVKDFTELYAYYKDACLLQLSTVNSKLLASFRIGDKISDVRVFRWAISPDGQSVTYIDNRGERDIQLPPAHDFEWVRTGRENAVYGRHPHMNILDTVFVETVGGDLTIKRENNTEDGLGIYSEDVLDKNQSLDDGQIEYAKVGLLILLKIRPYRENDWRYLVYNTLTHDVKRLDALGQACIQLPEDHGLIFPGGYYLQNGECKTFEHPMDGMLFRKMIKSPNGEDALYVFYAPNSGRLALFNYNLIERSLQTPLFGNGYTLWEDGRMMLFEDQGATATRIHPMQIWQTPFHSDEYAAQSKNRDTILSRIGNADLVRGLSDIYNLAREIDAQKVSAALYDKLSQDALRLFDIYFWMKDEGNFKVAALLREIAATGELVIDEYEKVEAIRNQSAKFLRESAARQQDLLAHMQPDNWSNIQEFSESLSGIHLQKGRLIALKSLRYMDIPEVEKLEAQLSEREKLVSEGASAFLAGEKALEPLTAELKVLEAQTVAAENAAGLNEPKAGLEKMSGQLDLLSELMASLPFDDATVQTRIVENISSVYALVNQARARLDIRLKEMGREENAAGFGAQLKLFSQSLAASMNLATDPERCDDERSRLLLRLEELESQFGDQEEFAAEIFQKREELLEIFEVRKQSLLDERRRRAQNLAEAAKRILEGLPRRMARLNAQEELHAFFAADTQARKIKDIIANLRALNEIVKADDLEAGFKAAQDQAARDLKDKVDLYDEGGSIIKFGPRHRFSVNSQALELALLPKDGALYLSLTGTDFTEPLQDEELASLSDYWPMTLEAESNTVSRAEYLAYSIIYAAKKNKEGFSLEGLRVLLAQPEKLEQTVRDLAASRYREGYEKGLHDHDAVLILKTLLPLLESAGLLRFSPSGRALGMLFWQRIMRDQKVAAWPESARASWELCRLYNDDSGLATLTDEIHKALTAFLEQHPDLTVNPGDQAQAAEFLCQTLARAPIEFTISKNAHTLYQELRGQLEERSLWAGYAAAQRNLEHRLAERWLLMASWCKSLTNQPEFQTLQPYGGEAAALAILDNCGEMNLQFSEVDLNFEVEGLLSSHPRFEAGRLNGSLDDFFSRLRHHRLQMLPGFRKFQAARRKTLKMATDNLRLEEFKPRPLTSFVRNQLIDQVYLPIIGDNLAKQIGAVGEAKRSDLMGLLLLISPPGYGKTTLMEYVAHCLGMVFMKINGPALGRSVISLDPERAIDAAAAQELQKLNLALEMSQNVMLYLDDIQHVNPEFLQKFISLCDATRRIEGIWRGRSKTYDLRGKRFCVVMAGNPYTESGEAFKVPDMLANRADVYNLGEVLGGLEEAFALSYVENCLTSNPALQPLAQRDLSDLHQFLELAQGRAGGENWSYDYSPAERAEIIAVLARLLKLRNVIMAVNRAYIESAAQSDQYRTEPPFKLQGSYRNMNKLAQQVSAVMNDAELGRLLDDLYAGEAQLLTGYAEENILKLAEIRNKQTVEQAERWAEIKRQFMRNQTFGGDKADVGDRLVAQLADLAHYVQALGGQGGSSEAMALHLADMVAHVKGIGGGQASGAKLVADQLHVLSQEFKTALMELNHEKARSVTYMDNMVKSLNALSQNRMVVKVSDLVQNVAPQRNAQPGQSGPPKATQPPIAGGGTVPQPRPQAMPSQPKPAPLGGGQAPVRPLAPATAPSGDGQAPARQPAPKGHGQHPRPAGDPRDIKPK